MVREDRVVRSCLNLIPPQPSALGPAPGVTPRDYPWISAGITATKKVAVTFYEIT